MVVASFCQTGLLVLVATSSCQTGWVVLVVASSCQTGWLVLVVVSSRHTDITSLALQAALVTRSAVKLDLQKGSYEGH